MNKGYEYIDQYGSFRMEDPQKYSYLYFPIANDAGMKSSLTPEDFGMPITFSAAYLKDNSVFVNKFTK